MKYFIRKFLILILTVFLISLMTFVAFHVIPGDPARLILGTSASEEAVEALREKLGTNLPLTVQYRNWIAGFLRGDFGTSIKYRMPVAALMHDRIPVTTLLGVMALVLILPGEHVLNFINILGISFPNFFLSIIFIWIFGLTLHWFTPGRYITFDRDWAGCLRFMFWPALSVAIPQTAVLVKYVRTAMLEQLREDYVRTARGKGVGETAILYVHVFKNAIVAVVPLIGMIIASVLSGSIIIEQVYGIPGIGKLLISSVTSRDFPLTQTLVVYIAVIIVVINFLVDIVIQIIDPRIRLADRG